MIGDTDLPVDIMLSFIGSKILALPYGWKIGEFVAKWHGVLPDLGRQAVLWLSVEPGPGSPSRTLFH